MNFQRKGPTVLDMRSPLSAGISRSGLPDDSNRQAERRRRESLGKMFDVGCDQRLNEIAVSDRGTLRGLTQFCGRQSLPRFKPLNAKEIEEQVVEASACGIILSKPLATH
jgi:hypothetical protein